MADVMPTAEIDLTVGLTDKQLALRPVCQSCGWRKGGLDSWNGTVCKCGHSALTFRKLFNAH
jgi:hypothetical protein